MFAAAAVTYAVPVIGKIGSALGSYDKEKDEDRRRGNAEVDAIARSTKNKNAYLWMLARSGRAGTVIVPGDVGGGRGAGSYEGWASEPARDDAWKRYQALKPIFEPQTQFSGNESPDEKVAEREQAQAIAQAGSWVGVIVVVGLLVGALLLGGRKAAA
jgi:hypothetical protein